MAGEAVETVKERKTVVGAITVRVETAKTLVLVLVIVEVRGEAVGEMDPARQCVIEQAALNSACSMLTLRLRQRCSHWLCLRAAWKDGECHNFPTDRDEGNSFGGFIEGRESIILLGLKESDY